MEELYDSRGTIEFLREPAAPPAGVVLGRERCRTHRARPSARSYIHLYICIYIYKYMYRVCTYTHIYSYRYPYRYG